MKLENDERSAEHGVLKCGCVEVYSLWRKVDVDLSISPLESRDFASKISQWTSHVDRLS